MILIAYKNVKIYTHCRHCAVHLHAAKSISDLRMCTFLPHSLDRQHFSYFLTFFDRQPSNVNALVDVQVVPALCNDKNNVLKFDT